MAIRFLSSSATGGAPWLRSRWIPLLVGGVLLTAACLKAHRLFTDPPSSAGIFEAPWFQVMLVEAELACGLALCLGLWPRPTRWAALFLFACFFGAALSQALAGAKSCACFGNAALSPVLAALLDAGLFAALASWKPPQRESPAPFPLAFRYTGLAGVAALLAFPVAVLGFARADAYPRLEVSPATLDLGTIPQGDRRVFALRLRNPHNKPVTIDHLQTSCPCLEAQGLPWSLSAGAQQTVEFVLDMAREPQFLGRLLIAFHGVTPVKRAGLVVRLHLTVASKQELGGVSP